MVILIGITGSVASGKGVVSAVLRRGFGVPVFDSDATARFLCLHDQKVIGGVRSVAPSLVADKVINRRALAETMWTNPKLFGIVSGIIAEGVVQKMVCFVRARSCMRLVAAEIPMLFELDLGYLCDFVVALHTSSGKRRVRFATRSGDLGNFDAYDARQIAGHTKCALADYVINNDLSRQAVFRQVFDMLGLLKKHSTARRCACMAIEPSYKHRLPCCFKNTKQRPIYNHKSRYSRVMVSTRNRDGGCS